ncbi:MAG: YkgJ family cysteine cluster protein [archaeon]|nr:YkgJ family cysteine cluster protein [archaeon]
MSEEEKKENIEEETKKAKFICVKSFNSCEKRGPLPITFSDMQLWAKDSVIDNFLSHLRIEKNEDGGLDLVMAPLKYKSKLFEMPDPPKPEGEEKVEGKDEEKTDDKKEEKEEEKEEEEPEIDEIRCPMFNLQKRECLIYKYRPQACRSYPLEFDGENYSTIDSECPRLGEGQINKEERIEMRDEAKKMHPELITMRIAIPLLFSVIQREIQPSMMQMAKQQVFMEMIMEQQQAMEKMSPEEKEKLMEIQKMMAEKEGKVEKDEKDEPSEEPKKE